MTQKAAVDLRRRRKSGGRWRHRPTTSLALRPRLIYLYAIAALSRSGKVHDLIATEPGLGTPTIEELRARDNASKSDRPRNQNFLFCDRFQLLQLATRNYSSISDVGQVWKKGFTFDRY